MMQWVYVLAVAVLSAGVWADECAPPMAGDKVALPKDCCKKEDKIPDVLKEQIAKCQAKFPISKDLESGRAIPKEAKNAVACTTECVFQEGGILTADKKIDVAAFKKVLAAAFPDKKDIPANVDKCYSVLSSRIDKSLDCTSGAFELENCMYQHCFLNCPKDKWNATPECEALKKTVEKCPNYPVAILM